eukprot:TRINITY_DN67162_c6_g1_i1.p1 TRINITY_DN67162_c6_g1~~TRINITY_DN67162_c6_g1_i1.p1  ORF type:complete len:607 (+),score=47.23 TRINITY_DN67162_c6_g1_i1:33-1853(+)
MEDLQFHCTNIRHYQASLQVIKRAVKLGHCLRCCLRLISYRIYSLYTFSEVDLLTVINTLTSDTEKIAAPDAVCPACLGMLRVAGEQNSVLQNVIDAYKKSPYSGLRDYHLCIAIPRVAMLRAAHLALLALSDAPATITPEGEEPLKVAAVVKDVLDLKETLSGVLKYAIDNLSGLGFKHCLSSEREKGLKIYIDFTHEESRDECGFVLQLPTSIMARSREVSITVLGKLLACVSVKDWNEHCAPKLKTTANTPVVWATTLSNQSVLLTGYYHKYSRELAQSPWIFNGVRKTPTSIQELICIPILKKVYTTLDIDKLNVILPPGHSEFRGGALQSLTKEKTTTEGEESGPSSAVDALAFDTPGRAKILVAKDQQRAEGSKRKRRKLEHQEKEKLKCHPKGKNFNTYATIPLESWYNFHSTGREDADVRMLGTGRPFVVELIDPHKSVFTEEELTELEELVNASDPDERIHISKLAVCSQPQFAELMAASETKDKQYQCVVWVSRPISELQEQIKKVNELKDLHVAQKTPIRVIHRRTIMVRDKLVSSITCTPINDHWMVVDLRASAGAYIKEFVNGDSGRTTPSLGDLLDCRAEILQLDVTGVFLK